MTENLLEYWRPGAEERRLRIFISHRFANDEDLYGRAISALNSNGFAVQDMSLSSDKALSGPQGGKLPKLQIQADVAARIYTSDVVIAPSVSGVSQSQWVTWEVQLAAVGYGVPILFVNRSNQRRSTDLVKQVDGLGLPHLVCEPNAPAIVQGVIELVHGRPRSAMRQEEPEPTLVFRGPPASARQTVLKNYPFQARLAAVDPEPAAPAKKKFWLF